MSNAQKTLDSGRVKASDRIAKRHGRPRPASNCAALPQVVKEETIRAREERHRQGYLKMPVREGEFSVPAADHLALFGAV